MKFRVGDVVLVNQKFPGPYVGLTGKVKYLHGAHIAVEFDEPILDGTTLGGRCRDDCGHYLLPQYLVKLEPVAKWLRAERIVSSIERDCKPVEPEMVILIEE